MLKIGFDAKRAFLNNTGLGNYSRALIHSLSEYFPENQYYLYTPFLKENHKAALDLKNTTFRTASIPFLKSLWRSRLINKDLIKDELDIYHGLSHELPIGIQKTGIKTVVTIHDLIFLRYPEFYKRFDRKIYDHKIKYACSIADKIIAVSEQTKKDLIQFYNIPEEQIVIIYQSCHADFKQNYAENELGVITEKYKLPKRYILNVGTIEERKNLMLLVKSMQQLPNDIELVVVGRPTAYADKVKGYILKNNLIDRIHFLENVSFNDLPKIYQLSDLFVYTSFFEGFGIPILEALNMGVPVIASTGSCLEEAGGPESIYVNPNHAIELSETIIHLWNNETKKNEMIKVGKLYAKRFEPLSLAQQLMDLYQKLL